MITSVVLRLSKLSWHVLNAREHQAVTPTLSTVGNPRPACNALQGRPAQTLHQAPASKVRHALVHDARGCQMCMPKPQHRCPAHRLHYFRHAGASVSCPQSTCCGHDCVSTGLQGLSRLHVAAESSAHKHAPTEVAVPCKGEASTCRSVSVSDVQAVLKARCAAIDKCMQFMAVPSPIACAADVN